MTKKENKKGAVRGVRITASDIDSSYSDVFHIGSSNESDPEVQLAVLLRELQIRIDEMREAQSRSLDWLHSNEAQKIRAMYMALREALQLYPLTREGHFRGDSLPFCHAEEIVTESILLASSGVYKSAFQRLREVLEMVVLQIHFFLKNDRQFFTEWGRGQTRTPSMKNMLEQIKCDARSSYPDNTLNITDKIYAVYDQVGAFIHSRGLMTMNAGLNNSNLPRFSQTALARFESIFLEVVHAAILFVVSFFPTGIVALPAFQKFGHLDPLWLPRPSKIKCIRAALTLEEVKALEKHAKQNAWLGAIKEKLAQVDELTETQIEETYRRVESIGGTNPLRLQEELFRVSETLLN